jgi:hypothetical protein
MFSTFFAQLSGFFDKHWLLRYFFPSLAFWAAGLAVYGAAREITEPLDLWHSQPTEVQVILLAGALLWVTLFAYLLANFSTALTRLFEGYWVHWPLTWLRTPRQAFYEERFRYLATELGGPGAMDPRKRQGLEREWLLLFPQGREREKAVLPTRLGNILRAAEIYPLARYGADAVILWPRLVPFFPAEFNEALNGAQTAMEVMLVLSALSFIFSVIACTLLAALTFNVGLFLVCTAGFLLAWICYRNSLHGALGYAELIKTAFDLYRGKLLEGLGSKPLSDPKEERKTWDGISQKIYRNIPFSTTAPKPEPAPQTWLGKALGEFLELMRAAFPKPKSPVPPVPTTTTAPLSPPLPAPVPEPRDLFPFAYFGTLVPLCLVAAGIMNYQERQPVQRVALTRDVPAYRLLSDQDLMTIDVARSETPGDAIHKPGTVSGRAYLIQPLAKGSVLRKSWIHSPANSGQFAGRVAVGIQVNAATVLGGELRPGDSVDLVIVPAKDASAPAPGCEKLANLLTLDVKPPEKAGSSYIVILAAPPACQATLAGAAGRISLSRGL